MTRVDLPILLSARYLGLVAGTRWPGWRVLIMRTACVIVILASTVLGRAIKSHKRFLCEENGYFLNPYNCSGFYLCEEGIAVWQPCPDHLHPRWESPHEVYCDIPENVNCTSLYADDDEDGLPDPEFADYEHFCSGRSAGIYGDPVYCFRFVMCSSGSGLGFDCPSRMRFDGAHGVCVQDDQCSYYMKDDEDYSGSSGDDGVKLAVIGSAELNEVAQIASGEEEKIGSGDQEVTSPHYGDMKIDNGRVEQLKRNIDSV